MSVYLSSEDRRKVSVNMPRTLWRKLGILAASRDTNRTDLLIEWLAQRISQEAPQLNHGLDTAPAPVAH